MVGGSRNNTPLERYEIYERPRGKTQWSGARGGGSQHCTGPTQYSRGVDGTYSSWTDSRTFARFENERVGGGTASGLEDDDDRRAPRGPYGIQCYNCGLAGHIRSNCRRGQKRNLNGIGRTKRTPPSNPK